MSGNLQQAPSRSDNDNSPEHKFTGTTKARNRLAIVSSTLAVLFAISTVVFVALFTYTRVTHAEQAAPEADKLCNTTECVATAAPITDKFCSTTECVATAGRMIDKMNLLADPCVDFDDFACGGYNRETLIPDGEYSVDSTTALGEDNLLVIKGSDNLLLLLKEQRPFLGILTEEIREGEPRHLTNMKREYMECMEKATGDMKGLAPYLTNVGAKEWPTINKNWTGNSFKLSSVIARYILVDVLPFFSVSIRPYEMDSGMLVIDIDQPKFILQRDYLIRPRNDTVIMAYQKFLTDIAVELGASTDVAEQDAKDVVNLEIALSKIMLPKEEYNNIQKRYLLMRLGDLSTVYPELDMTKALRALANQYNSRLTNNDFVLNMVPDYMANISRVVKDFSNRTLQNIFGFKYAIPNVIENTSRMKAIQAALFKVLLGVTGTKPRWWNCVTNVANSHTVEIQKEFLARKFSDDIKADIKTIFTHIKDAFKQMVVENTWMSNATKEEVYKKVAAIKLAITNSNYDGIQEETRSLIRQFITSNENTITGQIETDKHSLSEEFIKALWKPRTVQRTAFSHLRKRKRSPVNPTPHRVGNTAYGTNAEFDLALNTIILDPGTLQPPFFSKNSQNYINYGAIGAAIAHELTHAFDDIGYQYDELGKLSDLWQPSDKLKYLQRMQCIIDQTSSFYLEEINMNLNGFYTLGECLADTGGIKESFRAYKDTIRKNGEEPRLPVLNLTQEQLFFVSYAQTWCYKSTKESNVQLILTDVHPPDRYRIIGPLQNSEDFAKAYNCPRGSYMNPEKKCDVW